MRRASVVGIALGIAAVAVVLTLVGCEDKPVPSENGVTVRILSAADRDTIVEMSTAMSVSRGPTHVRWKNETKKDYKLKFDIWPFSSRSKTIEIKAGHTSAWYKLAKDSVEKGGRPFRYHVSPPLTRPLPPSTQVGEAPPDEPDISGQP